VALGSLPTFQLQGVEEEVLRRLHSALYGTPGQQQSRKKDLRDWQGNSADDAASRLRKPIASWKIEELRAVSRLCGLAPSKTKSEHERGLVAFLQKPYCVPPGKEPAEPTKKTGTKRTVEQPAPTSSRSGAACGSSAISVVRKKRAKSKEATPDVVEPTQDNSQFNDEDGDAQVRAELIDSQFRMYEDVRRPTLVEMYPDLEESFVTMLVTREWEEILNGAAPEDAFKAAWANCAKAVTAVVH
jgi:hypothetical protein